MPDYLDYQKSIAKELLSIKNRVRNFIDDAHWGEDGRYKEIILLRFLRKILPSNISVGTGFVRSNKGITKQIDIIIYNNLFPVLFSEGDFVIVLSESVIGIIEVKSKLTSTNTKNAIIRCNNNAKIINEHFLFNGIFSYDTDIIFSNESSLAPSIHDTLYKSKGLVNYISFSKDIFVKYWNEGNPNENDGVQCYSFYKIFDLSYGYFLSNMIYNLYGSNESEFKKYLFPIPEGKEVYRFNNLDVRLL